MSKKNTWWKFNKHRWLQVYDYDDFVNKLFNDIIDIFKATFGKEPKIHIKNYIKVMDILTRPEHIKELMKEFQIRFYDMDFEKKTRYRSK